MNRPIVQRNVVVPQPIPPQILAPQAIQQPQAQPQGPALSPAAQKMLADFDLLQGEVIHYSIQGDGFFSGSNPFIKIFAALNSALVAMTGGHIRVFIVVTNRRILLVQSQAAFFGFRRTRSVNTIALASLAEAGSARDTQWFCIHTRTVTLVSQTQRYTLVIKNINDRALREFVWNLSAVLVANTHNRTN